MIPCNTEITITNDNPEMLSEAISLLMNGFQFVPVAFNVPESGSVALYGEMLADIYIDGLTEISPQNRTVSFVEALVLGHLQSKAYNEAFEESSQGNKGWKLTFNCTKGYGKVLLTPWLSVY